MDIIFIGLLGFANGWILSALGYKLSDWQFWAITLTLAVSISYLF